MSHNHFRIVRLSFGGLLLLSIVAALPTGRVLVEKAAEAANGDGKAKDSQRAPLSAAEKAEIEQWQGETWRIGVDLDMPSLEPPAVQYAVFDEDPLPAFTALVKRMSGHYRQQLKKADNEARREQLRAIQMTVGWNLGFKKVTGDKLYLLAKGPRSSKTTLSSNSPGGKKWIVTKTVRIDGKPVCWCIPVELAKGKRIDITFEKSNTFDLQRVYDEAMKEAEGGGEKATPAPGRRSG